MFLVWLEYLVVIFLHTRSNPLVLGFRQENLPRYKMNENQNPPNQPAPVEITNSDWYWWKNIRDMTMSPTSKTNSKKHKYFVLWNIYNLLGKILNQKIFQTNFVFNLLLFFQEIIYSQSLSLQNLMVQNKSSKLRFLESIDLYNIIKFKRMIKEIKIYVSVLAYLN